MPLTTPTTASRSIRPITPPSTPAATAFVRWFDALLYQKPANDAWVPDRLEYRFACSAPEGAGEKVFAADEYYQGHLDWYNFAVDSGTSALPLGEGAAAPPDPQADHTLTLIPTQVTFDGMPNTRWWAFEDGRTNFGDIKPDRPIWPSCC